MSVNENDLSKLQDKEKSETPCTVGALANVLDKLSLDECALQDSQNKLKDNNCEELKNNDNSNEGKDKSEVLADPNCLAELVGKKRLYLTFM